MYKNLALLLLVLTAAAINISAQLSRTGLVGIWKTGGLSTTDDINTVTGSRTASNGNTLKYEFKADGRFAFVGYMQSTMYGCTTALFNDKQGRYSLNGSQLSLTLVKNFWRNTYSCSPASNKERNYTLDTEVYDVSTKTDEYGKLFICLANEKGESCYRRENQ
jgi:hypothetical protein